MVKLERRAGVVIVSLLLGACGGGGGGGSKPPSSNVPNPPVNVPNPPANPPANAAPTIAAGTFTVAEDTDLSGQLTVADSNGDTLTLTSADGPTLGTLVSLNNSGAFVYRPNANVSGADSFNVSVSDGRGGTASAAVSITVTAVDDAPSATNDEFAVPAAQTTSLAVLTNDPDIDGGTATVTIEGAALVGSASVNADNTVRIDNLPGGFKGLTRFTYRVASAQGASTTATAVVFVDTAPFRAVFSLDVNSQDSDIVISDFTGEPRALLAASASPMRVRSYTPSKNGAVVAIMRANPNTTSIEDICFVRTQGTQPVVCPALPEDFRLTTYAVSPNGRWIAAGLRHRDNSTPHSSLMMIDTEAATSSFHDLTIPYVRLPRFSADSQYLYYVASDVMLQDPYVLNRVSVTDPGTPVQMGVADTSSSIESYELAEDNSRIVLQRVTGTEGYFLVDTTNPSIEVTLNHTLQPGEGFHQQALVLLNADATMLTYVILRTGLPTQVYVADVSATPNPRLLYTLPTDTTLSAFPQIRSDGLAMLIPHHQTGDFTTGQVVEKLIDDPTPEVTVADALTARYAGAGDSIVTQQFLNASSGPRRFYVAHRADFASEARLGVADTYNVDLNDPSELTRGVALAGVTASSAANPTNYTPTFFNLAAPEAGLPLSERQTRLSNFYLGASRLFIVDAP